MECSIKINRRECNRKTKSFGIEKTPATQCLCVADKLNGRGINCKDISPVELCKKPMCYIIVKDKSYRSQLLELLHGPNNDYNDMSPVCNEHRDQAMTSIENIINSVPKHIIDHAKAVGEDITGYEPCGIEMFCGVCEKPCGNMIFFDKPTATQTHKILEKGFSRILCIGCAVGRLGLC